MQVLRRPKFIDDLSDAYAWLAERDVTAAGRLLDEVDAVVGLLALFPDIGRVRSELGPGVRSIRLQRFRHVVFYRRSDGTLVLLRLLHGARDIGSNPMDV